MGSCVNRISWSGPNSFGLGQELVAGSCEYGNEPSCLIKGGLLGQLSHYYLLKKETVLRS